MNSREIALTPDGGEATLRGLAPRFMAVVVSSSSSPSCRWRRARVRRRVREPGRDRVVGQFDCGRLSGWKTGGTGRILRLMDDPAIKLYPDKNSGAWNWELLLRGKRIAHGESSDTQEAAYTAARQALAEERERRSNR